MKTQTFKSGENMVMSLTGNVDLVVNQEDGMVKLLATTDTNIKNVTHIPTEWFFKGVDVMNIAIESADDNYLLADPNKAHYILGFIAGYNSNKNAFTMEEYEEAISIAFIHGQQNVLSKEWALKSMLEFHHHLNLPKSLTVTEDFKLVKIEW